ncbi:MAG: stage III sporulation protein AE [Chitinophagales bacterium]
MLKKKLIFLIIVLALFLCPFTARAAEQQKDSKLSWSEVSSKVDLQQMEKFKEQVDQEMRGYLGDKSTSQWVSDFVKGKWQFNFSDLLGSLFRYLVGEVAANGRLMGKILVLAVVSALLVNMQSSFESQGAAKMAGMACFLALSAIALGSFKSVLQAGSNTVGNLSDFMASILPQMMILVTGLGHVHTAAAMFPLLMVASTAFAKGISTIIIPLIIFSAVLHLIDCLSDTVKVERMAKLVYTLVEILLVLFMSVFVILLGLRTLYGSVLDAITLKTGKIVADVVFPVIGGNLGEALEIAAGYVVLLKHAVGILGMLIILGMFILPVLKIGAVMIIYKVSAAIIEPMGDARTSKALDIMGNHLGLVMATVAGAGLMFLILMAIVGSIGNSVILVR